MLGAHEAGLGLQSAHKPCTALVLLKAREAAVGKASPELLKVQGQHNKLLKQITAKRHALSSAHSGLRRVEQHYALHVEHLQTAIRDIRRELKEEFEYFLSAAHGLSKKDRSKVRRLQRELFDDAESRSKNAPAADPYDVFDGAAEGEDDTSSDDAEHPSGNAERSKSAESSTENSDSGRAGHEKSAGRVTSANKPPGENRILRSVFIRLTIALHPDKSQNEAERRKLTIVMQEVTAAYERQDLAALLTLQRDWLTEDRDTTNASLAGLLKQLRLANTALRQQLKALTAELRAVKDDSLLGTATSPGTEDAAAPMDSFIDYLERGLSEAQRLRQVALAFRRKQLTPSKFVSAHYVTRDPEFTPATIDDDAPQKPRSETPPAPPAERVVRRKRKATSRKAGDS